MMTALILALFAVLLCVAKEWYAYDGRRHEAPHTPSLGSVEKWEAELDVALGLAWHQESAVDAAWDVVPMPSAPRPTAQPCRIKRVSRKPVWVQALDVPMYARLGVVALH